MDPRSVLEHLDSVRPDSDDLALPELEAAREVLRGDEAVAAEFERRQNWDRQFSVAMHDVSVPPELKSRLLVKIAAEAPRSRVQRGHLDRRRLLGLSSGIAASLLAAAVLWAVVGGSEHPIPMAEVRNAAALLLADRGEAVPFQGDFSPQLPAGNWRRLPFEPGIIGLLPDDDGGHRAAGWTFSFGRQRRLQGVLIAVPVDVVAAPPTAEREYVGGNAVAWTEGGFVYVCRVNGSIDELLRQLDDARLA